MARIDDYKDVQREKKRLYMQNWQNNNRTRVNELARECYAHHKEVYAANKRQARLENGDKIREQMRASYYRHREERLESMLEYAKVNAIKFAGYSHNRRAKIQNVFIENIDRVTVFEASNGICYLCKEELTDSLNWHLDHIVPLAAGGLHAYDNVAATHPLCNLKKGDRILEAPVG